MHSLSCSGINCKLVLIFSIRLPFGSYIFNCNAHVTVLKYTRSTWQRILSVSGSSPILWTRWGVLLIHSMPSATTVLESPILIDWAARAWPTNHLAAPCWSRVEDPCTHTGLSHRILPTTRGQNVPKFDLWRSFGSYSGPLQGFFDDSWTQVMDRNGGQDTPEGAYDGTTQTMAIGRTLHASCHMTASRRAVDPVLPQERQSLFPLLTDPLPLLKERWTK